MKNEIIMSYVLPPPSIQVYIQHFVFGKWVHYLVFILVKEWGGEGEVVYLDYCLSRREREMSGIL
jgi:hypothetical protein